MNQLAVHQDDANVLLHQKNVLSDAVVDKYRTAGQITEKALRFVVNLINEMYHYKTEDLLTIQELCLVADSFLQNSLDRVYVKGGLEKSISTPTSFNINEFISNFSPEISDSGAYYFKEGDVITVNLGVHIDGYTSNASHTICIYPPGEKPVGPLLGPKADCIVASYLATEIVIALLGLSMTPEKLPAPLKAQYGGLVTGKMVKQMVNVVAEQFNCRVIPGSEVRVIRRFLTGQNDVVDEKGYKGIAWDERDQEVDILRRLGIEKTKVEDDFTVKPGEVYQINLKMASVANAAELGIVIVDDIKEHSGLNNRQEFNMRPTIFVRDYIMNYQLKLKTSRSLLAKVDKNYSVYPFKLSFLTEGFPLADYTNRDDIEAIKAKVNDYKLGLSELTNRNLVNSKAVQTIKAVPVKKLLNESTTTELINGPTLQKLAKNEPFLSDKAIESTAVIINDLTHEVLRVSNTMTPVYCHSDYRLDNEVTAALLDLLNDKKFGIPVKSVQPKAD